MQAYSLDDAQAHLQDLIEKALQGQEILIQGDSQMLVQLVPVATLKQARKAGSARGLIKLTADFDQALADFDDYIA